jgi:hypothetical protein
VSRLPEDRIVRRRAKQSAAGAQRSRRVAGSRRTRKTEVAPAVSKATETEIDETPIGNDDIEPGDVETHATGADTSAEADTESTDGEADPASEADADTDAGDETNADSAKEKGK